MGVFSVIRGQPRFKISIEVALPRTFNGLPGEPFAKNVGGHGDNPLQARTGTAAGMDQGDGTAVGVADKQVIANPALPKDLGQHRQSLVMHEIDPSRKWAGVGTTVSQAAVDQCTAAGAFCQTGRKIPPQGHASQPFVKEYQGGRSIRTGTDPFGLQPPPGCTRSDVESDPTGYF